MKIYVNLNCEFEVDDDDPLLKEDDLETKLSVSGTSGLGLCIHKPNGVLDSESLQVNDVETSLDCIIIGDD